MSNPSNALPPEVLDAFGQLADTLRRFVGAAVETLQEVRDRLTRQPAASGAAGNGGLAGKTPSGGLSGDVSSLITTGLGAVGAEISGVIGPLAALGAAANAITGPFQLISGLLGQFVGALNPSVMLVFNNALRNLQATIGVALVPIFQRLASLANSLSQTLFPAMQALRPILDNLASVLEGNLIPIVGLLADVFVALAPLIEFVTDILSTLAETSRIVVSVFRAVAQTLIDFIASFFGGVDLKDAASQFRDVIRQLTKYLVEFTAYLAKSLGQLGFIDHLIKNLQDLQGKAPAVVAAPQNTRVSGFESIGKELAVAAFAAQEAGSTKKKSEADYLKDLVDSLKDVKANGKTLQEWIKTDLIPGLEEIFAKVVGKTFQEAEKDIGIGWRTAQIWLLARENEIIDALLDRLPRR